MKKKLFLLLSLLLPAAMPVTSHAAVAEYDPEAALAGARADVANWMSYLPDDVFVAHVSIPGTHDTATGEGWISSTGPTYSTTQEKTIDEQLAAGVRAFDFRPGLKSGYLNCNHGIDEVNLSLEDAFTKLTNYLDAHPKEFYIIHLFRGNVPNAGSSLTGGKNSDEDREQYNRLFNEFFNQGKFADYIVDYTPYLKVKDIRGKMVIFRRDRIEFAHVAKAGNLTNWPADSGEGTENHIVTATNASDPTVKGSIYATDISSPDDETQLGHELTSIENLFKKSSTQGFPNQEKNNNGTYKPYWVMNFTSGSYGLYYILPGINSTKTDKTEGYLKNATYTNPLLTNLLRTAQQNGNTGPAGTVFSDWVLTDSHDNYATMGVDLVPAIYENNFYYIKDFILDDELFNDNAVDAENFWEDGKEYFMRNVGSGLYLSAGQWWGTHATTNTYGLRITPHFDQANNVYELFTNIGTNAGLGDNDYADNASPRQFSVVHVGNGVFVFKPANDNSKALVAQPTSGFLDATPYTVTTSDYTESDPFQQWEMIDINQFYQESIASASMTNGVDISYNIGRWMKNDYTSNATWNISVSKSASGGLTGESDNNNCRYMLHFSNAKKGTFAVGWNASWSVSKDITDIPNGVYELSWDALTDNISDLTMTVNGTNVASLIKNINSGGTETLVNAATKFNTGEYTCTSPKIIVTDGKIEIRINCPTHSSATAAAFDNFRLTYYGPDPAAACDLVKKAMDDATGKVPGGADDAWTQAMAPYQAIIDSQNIIGDGTNEAMEIYQLLRDRVFAETTGGTDYTAAIINNSFEWGTTFGWDINPSADTGVYPNTNSVYHTDNCDGDYLFNTWSQGTPISQTIANLPAGHYKLQALAVTGDTEETRYIYLFANDQHSDAIEMSNNKVTMTEVEWEFDVAETSNVTIGMLGGNADGTYNEFGDQWYKADNFRLTYMGEPVMDTFYDNLELAIRLATERVNMIPEQYREGWDDEMAPYLAIINDKTLEGDGTREANEVYNLMRGHVFSQNFADADFTPGITNNSFERGDTYGWTLTGLGDTGVKLTSNDVYTVDNCDGDYLFNTWNGDDWGSPITQTLSGLPAGKYRLQALLTSDAGKSIWLTANDKRQMVTATAKTSFVEATLDIILTEETNELTIGAIGAYGNGGFNSTNGVWYKADNFRLSLVAPMTTIEWEMEGDLYDTLILPFNHERPADLELYCINDRDYEIESEEYHVLSLEAIDTDIEANVPYIVKKSAVTRSNGTTYTFTGIPENDSDTYTSGLLTGTHAGTTVDNGGHYGLTHDSEKGSYFALVNDTHTVAPAHAYINANEAANILSAPVAYFEAPEEDGDDNGDDTTGIESIGDDATGNVNVYTITGTAVRIDVPAATALDGLAPGVYILNNGSRSWKKVAL